MEVQFLSSALMEIMDWDEVLPMVEVHTHYLFDGKHYNIVEPTSKGAEKFVTHWSIPADIKEFIDGYMSRYQFKWAALAVENYMVDWNAKDQIGNPVTCCSLYKNLVNSVMMNAAVRGYVAELICRRINCRVANAQYETGSIGTM